MLVRPHARRGLAMSRPNTLRRPQLLPRYSTAHPLAPASSVRLLGTRSELLPRKKQSSQTSYGATIHRPLATAVDDSIRRHEDIPYDHIHSHASSNYLRAPAQRPLWDLRSAEPLTPISVKNVDEPLPRSRMTPNGLPGGVDENLSVLDACLQVNQLDRAAMILKRLGEWAPLPPAELVALHNQYLRAAIDRAFEQPNSEWSQSLHQWFELEIRDRKLPHTAETIACMLKVSIISTQGPRLERLVNRYMDMMPGESIFDVLDQDHILSQQDIGIVASIYQPSSNLAFDEYTELSQQPETDETNPTELSDAPSQSRPASEVTPEVLAVPQKGLGLQTLREVLSFFKDIKGQDISKLPYAQRREFQSRLEKDCVESAITRWREEHEALMKIKRNTALSSRALNSQLYEWQVAIEKRLEEEFELMEHSETRANKTREDMDRCVYGPFLRSSTPARLAAVTIMSVLNILATTGVDKGVQLSGVLSHLSKAVEEDIKYQQRQKQSELRAAARSAAWKKRKSAAADEPDPAQLDPSIPAEGPDLGVPGTAEITPSSLPPLPPVSAKEPKTAPPISPTPEVIEPPAVDIKAWPTLIKVKVGAALLSMLLDCAKIKVVREHPETKQLVSQIQPAMAHSTIPRKGKKVGLIMPNRFLVELLKQEPRGDFLARHLPMLVEPEPWSKFDKGGFLESPAHLVRIKAGEKDQRIYAEAALERGDMDQVRKGLDVLGRTAWQVNKPVFDVMLQAWNTGDEIAGIPPLNPKFDIPPEPESFDDVLAKRQWLKQVKLVENKKSGLHSERCFINFQMEIARAFKDQTFYFPHNMDFRGRAYPIPTYLNHMGADHVRGLLRFGQGKELGETGLRWLKIHLANVYGYDKASLGEREAFATEHLSDIQDTVANPLTGNRWWLKAEDPWQCLAACYELQAALNSPEPTKYISHLPVHQDGTCNGLQHYAALGGDTWGAQQVNLEPGDRPADVYTAVADLVKKGIAEDLEKNSALAKAVDGKITRKVVKQTVMTNVYGVTFIGAKAQVLKQLDAAYPDLEKETGLPSVLLASYIATKIFKALGTMFRGAHDIQHWLGECAGRVCRAVTPEQIERLKTTATAEKEPKRKSKVVKSVVKPSTKSAARKSHDEIIRQFRSTIVWTTPLRMPVAQPYRKTSSRIIQTCFQDLTLHVPERSDPVNRKKQLQAFPPNFIHSLDASHMLLSALECDEKGLTFAAVHDSFWTHAGDVDVMNTVLRDSFIRIHSEDVIGRLAAEFEARYKGSVYMAQIKKGTLVEKEITAHRRANKKHSFQELLEERERLRLLASSDAKERAKGRKMVTPGSIYEKMEAEESSALDDEVTADLAPVKLGNIADSKAEGEEDDADAPEEASSDSPETVPDHPVDDTERLSNMLKTTPFEMTLSGTLSENRSRVKATQVPTINVFLPLTFPKIPSKGEFDVSRLKGSQYFFS